MNHALRLLAASVLLLVLIASACQRQAIAQEGVQRERQRDAREAALGAQDFDFLAGSWQVLNRRLKARHVGARDWDEFPGRSVMRPVLGGLGNIDEVHFPTQGWSGVTLRFFNPGTRQWSIYWVNSRDGLMRAPVVGAFRGGVGEFFGDDLDGATRVRVRFRWTRSGPNTARWEQAFSRDGERTWETNWTMDLLRTR